MRAVHSLSDLLAILVTSVSAARSRINVCNTTTVLQKDIQI